MDKVEVVVADTFVAQSEDTPGNTQTGLVYEQDWTLNYGLHAATV